MSTQLAISTQVSDLKPRETEIYAVLSTRLLRNVENDELFEIVKKSVITCYALTGFKTPDSSDLGFMITAIVNELKNTYPSVREGEISIAFTRGVMKDYGEYMGLSAVVFCHFVRMYWMNNNRLTALRAAHAEMEKAQQKDPPTQEEQREAFTSRLVELYDYYKNKLPLSRHECAFYFEKLWKKKVIVFNDEVRDDIKKRAVKLALGEIDTTQARDKAEAKKIREAYESIVENGDKDTRVSVMARYLGLMYWFDCLTETGMSVEETFIWTDDEN